MLICRSRPRLWGRLRFIRIPIGDRNQISDSRRGYFDFWVGFYVVIYGLKISVQVNNGRFDNESFNCIVNMYGSFFLFYFCMAGKNINLDIHFGYNI